MKTAYEDFENVKSALANAAINIEVYASDLDNLTKDAAEFFLNVKQAEYCEYMIRKNLEIVAGALEVLREILKDNGDEIKEKIFGNKD